MNAELIDLYRAVQGFRGEWRVFDPVLYWGEFGVIIAISPATSFLTVQHKKGHISGIHPDDPDLLWLPPTAPRLGDDEARTLWGMVDWSTHTEDVHADGNVTIYTTRPLRAVVKQSPLPEALLRAIREQEGKG